MKKIFTLALGLGLAVAANAQVQRLILSEEFTNASCGPCASQNPAYNTLMSANTTKVVTLKYQTVWPGVDPMNAQNQSDVATRVTYYGVNGVPYAPMDGDTNITSATAYNGAPAAYNQTMIDARYAVVSHWTINLSHTLSADLDSIFITCVVTPDATNPSITGLKLRIALTEKEIIFANAPGSNGEKEFYNVMRKMYPSAAGQSLNATNLGAPFTYTVATALPTYLYDKNQISVVAFLQNDTHVGTAWEVQQAAYSDAQPLALDGALSAMTTVTGDYFCGSTFTPTVTLSNPGATALTAAVISYKLDNGAMQTYNWTGNLAPGATAVATLPAQTIAGGAHTFMSQVTSINGQTDINAGNNTQTQAVVSYAGGASLAGYTQAFATDVITNNTYRVINSDGGASWTYRSTVGKTAPGSARMNFYQSAVGEVDEMVMPPFSTTGITAATKVTFQVAASQYTDAQTPLTNDKIELQYSKDCGANWATIWTKSGAALATNGAPSGTASFIPTATQWREENVQLPAAALNQAGIILKWVATSDFGNMAYIDDINVSSNVGINDITNNNSLTVYPNPFSDNATVKLSIGKSENVSISLFNSFGQLVQTENKGKLQAGETLINVDGTNLASGIYMMNVTVGNKTYTQKVNIVK